MSIFIFLRGCITFLKPLKPQKKILINNYLIKCRKDEQIDYLTEELRKMKHEEDLRKTKFIFNSNG